MSSKKKKAKTAVKEKAETPKKETNADASPNGESGRDDTQARKTIRINGRFFLILVVSFIACGAGTFALHTVQMERNSRSLQNLATEAEEAGETQKAIAFLQQYLRFQPDDHDAKIKLADLVGSFSRDSRSRMYVLRLLEDVLRNDAERSDVDKLRRRVIDLSLEVRRYRTALDHLKILQDKLRVLQKKELPDKKPKPDHELTALEGLCLQGLGDYGKAIYKFLTAIDLSDTTIDHYVQLAAMISFRPDAMPDQEDLKALDVDEELKSLFPSRTKKATVETVIRGFYHRLIDHGRPQHLAHIAHASFLMSRREFGNAKKSIEKAGAIAKGDPGVLLAAAGYALALAREESLKDGSAESRRSLLDEAYGIALQGAKLPPPKGLSFLLQLAEIEQQRAGFADVLPDQRRQYLANAGKHLDACDESLTTYRKTPEGKKTENEDKLRRSEIALVSRRIELLFVNATEAGGTLSSEHEKTLNGDLVSLQRLGASVVQLELFSAKRLLAQKKWVAAAKKLSTIRGAVGYSKSLRRQIDLALLICYRQLRNTVARLQLLQQSLTSDPHWTEGRILFAGELASSGRRSNAIDQYRRAKRHLAAWLLQLPRIGRLPAAERGDRLKPVQAFLKQTELDDVAVTMLKIQIIAIDPASEKTRFKDIVKLLDAAISRHPKNVALTAVRTRFEAGRSDVDKKKRLAAAFALLDGYDEKFPNSTVLFITRARLAALLPGDEAGKILKGLIVSVDQAANSKSRKLKQADRVAVLEIVARSYAALKLMKDCRAVWARVAKSAPYNLGVHLAAAELDLRQNDAKAFQQDLKAIANIEGAGGPWGNYYRALDLVAQAVLKVAKVRAEAKKLPANVRKKLGKSLRKETDDLLGRAKRLLTHAVKAQPLWPQLHRQLGRIETLLGDRDAVFHHYSRAVELGDRTASVGAFLVHYWRLRVVQPGDPAEQSADRILRLFHREAPHVFRLDQLDLTDGIDTMTDLDFKSAIRKREWDKIRSKISQNPSGYTHQIMLAQIEILNYQQLTETEKAKKDGKGDKLLKKASEHFGEAIKLAKKEDAHKPWVIWISQLHRLKRTADAEGLITKAIKTLPAKLKHTTAAVCYVLMGKTKEAEDHYQKAVKAYPDDVRLRLDVARFYAGQRKLSTVIRHLDVVLDPKSSATSGQRAAARHVRVLAVAGGGYADYLKALKMLEDPGKASLADLYTRIRLLGNSPFNRDRLALIDVLEEVERRFKALKDGDRFQLARLYEKAGRWKDARKIVEDLLQKNPRDALLLGWYAVELLKNEPNSQPLLRQVRTLMSQLRGLQPESLATATVLAELQLAEKNPRSAAKTIQDAVGKIGKPGAKLTTAESAQLRLAAAFCERNKLMTPAKTILRRYAELSGKPEAILTVATFLGRQARHVEALQICKDAQKTCKPVSVAVAAAAIVSVGSPTDADIATARIIVEKAAKADPKSLQIRWQLAAVMTVGGKLREAETTYRNLLKQIPGNSAILNNLAWLLAMRNEKLREARAMIEQVILKQGPIGELLDTRAIILMRMQQPGKALADLKQAVEETPAAAKYLHLAQAHLALRNQPAAVEAMQKARDAGLSLKRLHILEHPGCRSAVKATGVILQE